MIARILADYPIESLLTPLIIVTLLGGLLVVLTKWRVGSRSLRVALYVALIYGIMEFGVCRNIFFFEAVSIFLKVDDIGFRQRGIIFHELRRRQKPWNAQYLAVGTSQTGAIYGPYSQQHKDLKIFALAGLGLVELPFYHKYIADHCGGTVLLYVSEFDLANKPSVIGLKLAPPQSPVELWRVSRSLNQAGAASIWEIADLWVANAVSLYRYQFIFSGFVNRISGENNAFPNKQVTAVARTAEFRRAEMELFERLNDRWFQTNATALDEFLTWCDRQGLRVVVVEGQYHPEARSMTKDLASKARSSTAAMCAKHKNARFLSVEATGAFTVGDYRDITHVTPQAGTRFTERLIAHLNRLDAAPAPSTSAVELLK